MQCTEKRRQPWRYIQQRDSGRRWLGASDRHHRSKEPTGDIHDYSRATELKLPRRRHDEMMVMIHHSSFGEEGRWLSHRIQRIHPQIAWGLRYQPTIAAATRTPTRPPIHSVSLSE
eukprot:GHVU01066546.1.p1 GENE.GHVU01066546.1~~GHVU01066546.1.p1  ORF type:complete len:116 (-),score=9.51 GHVU01066546.1:162-509(-)